jgi:hypothetical protein
VQPATRLLPEKDTIADMTLAPMSAGDFAKARENIYNEVHKPGGEFRTADGDPKIGNRWWAEPTWNPATAPTNPQARHDAFNYFKENHDAWERFNAESDRQAAEKENRMVQDKAAQWQSDKTAFEAKKQEFLANQRQNFAVTNQAEADRLNYKRSVALKEYEDQIRRTDPRSPTDVANELSQESPYVTIAKAGLDSTEAQALKPTDEAVAQSMLHDEGKWDLGTQRSLVNFYINGLQHSPLNNRYEVAQAITRIAKGEHAEYYPDERTRTWNVVVGTKGGDLQVFTLPLADGMSMKKLGDAAETGRAGKVAAEHPFEQGFPGPTGPGDKSPMPARPTGSSFMMRPPVPMIQSAPGKLNQPAPNLPMPPIVPENQIPPGAIPEYTP